jgi:hypothetical protein
MNAFLASMEEPCIPKSFVADNKAWKTFGMWIKLGCYLISSYSCKFNPLSVIFSETIL